MKNTHTPCEWFSYQKWIVIHKFVSLRVPIKALNEVWEYQEVCANRTEPWIEWFSVAWERLHGWIPAGVCLRWPTPRSAAVQVGWRSSWWMGPPKSMLHTQLAQTQREPPNIHLFNIPLIQTCRAGPTNSKISLYSAHSCLSKSFIVQKYRFGQC